MRTNKIWRPGAAILLLTVLTFVRTCEVFAADSSKQPNTVNPSDGGAVKEGDNIYFKTDSAIFHLSAPVPGQAAPDPGAERPVYCAPAGSRFVVQAIVQASTGGGNDKKPSPANVTVVKGYFPGKFDLLKTGLHFSNPDPHGDAKVALADKAKHPACGTAEWIHLDTTYEFTSTDFQDVGSQRLGFTWGPMIIPYKYYFTDHAIKGNPSTVLYVGYEGWFPGVSLAAVAAAGLGIGQTTSNASDGSNGSPPTPPDTNTSATYTVAVGLIATFGGGAIKAGVLTGRDYQSNAAQFKYENKQWIALSVGTSF